MFYFVADGIQIPIR